MPKEWGGIVPSEIFLGEAKKIVDEAEKKDIVLRALGGVGIRLHSLHHVDFCKRMGRLGLGQQEFSDLDFMAYRKQRSIMKDFFKSLGYVKRITTISTASSERQIYFHPEGWLSADVFFDKLLVANHPIDFRGRLELDYPTISPTDLLLEKLQIVTFSEKDLKDTLVLLFSHNIGEKDEREVINAKHIATLLSKDWGFWYTTTSNLKKIQSLLPPMQAVTEEERNQILSKVDLLLDRIEREPKTNAWKLRAIVGPKKRWYQHVETGEL
jgi:hypothetical protein